MRASPKTKELLAGGTTFARLTARKVTSSPEAVVLKDGKTAAGTDQVGQVETLADTNVISEGGIYASGHG